MKKIIILIISLLPLFQACTKDSEDLSTVTKLADIELNGDEKMTITVGDTFTDPGATATIGDEDVSSNIKVSGYVNTKEAGTYTLTYTVTNSDGIQFSVSRDVVVVEEGYVKETGVSGLFVSETYSVSAYGWDSNVTITDEGDGVYYVDDCLGNYYTAVGYTGYVYPCTILVKEDGSIKLVSGTTYLDDINGTYDFSTGSFSWTASFNGYDYPVAYEYVEEDNYAGAFGAASTNKVLVTTYYPNTKTAYTTTSTISPSGTNGVYTISDLGAGVLTAIWGPAYAAEGIIHVASDGTMKLKNLPSNVSGFSGSYDVSTDLYSYSYSFYSGYCTMSVSNYFKTGITTVTDTEADLKMTASTDSKTWYGDNSDASYESDTIQTLGDGYYCIADIFGKYKQHVSGKYSSTPAIFFIDTTGNITLVNKKYYKGIYNFSGTYDEDAQSFSWIVSDGETTYTVKTYIETTK